MIAFLAGPVQSMAGPFARLVTSTVARSAGTDPDAARDAACDATASSDICRVLAPTDFEPTDFPDAPSAAGGGGVLGLVLVVLLIVAILVASAWLLRAWLVGRNTDTDASGDDQLDEDLDEALAARIVDHETPPDRWRRLAAEHRDAGRHRDAIRCEYRGLVGDLARAGMVDEISGRTSGEERLQIRELAPPLSDDFSRAADLFDIAWFDDAAVTATDDERFCSASAAVLGSLRGAVANA